jgi:mannose-6-phosphate isomerase
MNKSEKKDYRPWGYFTILSEEPDHKVKRIVIFPGKRLSLQRHFHREEHWYIISGETLVTSGKEIILLKPGESIDIPLGTLHRIENPGKSDALIIEVQRGDYFGEDDIERFDDDFGRI